MATRSTNIYKNIITYRYTFVCRLYTHTRTYANAYEFLIWKQKIYIVYEYDALIVAVGKRPQVHRIVTPPLPKSSQFWNLKRKEKRGTKIQFKSADFSLHSTCMSSMSSFYMCRHSRWRQLHIVCYITYISSGDVESKMVYEETRDSGASDKQKIPI